MTMTRIFQATRYLILVAVAGSLVASATLLLYGGAETVAVVVELLRHGPLGGDTGKRLTLHFIELVDHFLLGTVFYIIALGLYELFIDDRLDLPHWLEIHDLDALKSKLISVVVVVMGVSFLGQVVTWDGETDLLRAGAGAALVIAALTFFLRGHQGTAGEPPDRGDGG
jgi:uncharacterized membrane protein YqhA